jgi:hypothetical protein
MRTSRKKVSQIAYVLVALILASILSACTSAAGSGQANQPGNTPGQQTSIASPNQQGTVQITSTPSPTGTRSPTGTPSPKASASPTATKTSATATATPAPAAGGQVPNFTHIFHIVLENTSYSHIIGSSQAPYINSLANQYGLATQFYAITHPSLPNYFTFSGGSTFGVTSDCGYTTPDCPQNVKNIADLIEGSGRTWVAYFESMPTACGTTRQPPYTIHLNPFVYYTDIVSNAQRCQSHVLPYDQAQFFAALNANNVPNYVWISPNLDNDMHNGTISQADSWLSANIGPILNSQAFQNNGLVILTFDEGDDSSPVDSSGCCGYSPGGGHIVTILISPLVKKGFKSTVPETHYNLLRTIEDAWGLAHLGKTANVSPMSEFFSSSGSASAVLTVPAGGASCCPSTNTDTEARSTFGLVALVIALVIFWYNSRKRRLQARFSYRRFVTGKNVPVTNRRYGQRKAV